MRTPHLPEELIQQFAINPSNCEPGIHNHINECERCRQKATNYQLMFLQIKELPRPAFDFDLTALALPRAAKSRKLFSWPVFSVALLGLVIMVATIYLLNQYVFDILTGLSTMMLTLFLVSAFAFLLFQGLDIYRRYQSKLDELNLY